MKTSVLLLLVALARQTVSTSTPLLQWDPDTVKDCIEWYNGDEGMTCEDVRSYFGITSAEFHTWNPSVGLDCKPWYYDQSYCIVTETKYNATRPTTTSSQVTISTTTAATLGPSPTAWTALGCYVEDPKFPILEQNMNPNGDASLTIPKCKNSCYRRAFGFAGVQKGNQCWCGTYVGGNWANNQTSCNAPCTGDKTSMCGGSGFVNVFRAEENQAPAPTTSSSVKPTSTKAATPTVSKSGAAKRGSEMFWPSQ